MKKPLCYASAVLAILTLSFQDAFAANPVVRFHTDLGDIDVVLLRDIAPNTVANFLGYVNRHNYDNTFIHRSVANFVIQGGGYFYDGTNTYVINSQPAVANEFSASNKRGTLAMAKLSNDPNSATSQWFFNLSDNNAPSLDTTNGGYTVFGRVLSTSGLSMMDTIAAVPKFNLGVPFNEIPLKNYTSGPVAIANLVNLISVRELPTPSLTLSRPTANTVRLSLNGVQGTAYTIQSSVSLLQNSFSPLTTMTTDATGIATYEGTATEPKKFFRISLP